MTLMKVYQVYLFSAMNINLNLESGLCSNYCGTLDIALATKQYQKQWYDLQTNPFFAFNSKLILFN